MKVVGVDLNDLGTKSVLAAAAFYDVVYDFEVSHGTCCGSHGKKNPFSEVKHSVSLDAGSPLGKFCGHLTICNFFMEFFRKDDGMEFFVRTDASSWMEFFYERLDVGSRCSTVTKVDAESTSELAKNIRAIDGFLTSHTYLVGEELSVADFVCVVTIDHLVSNGKLDEAYLKDALRSLSRLIRTVKGHSDFVEYTEKLELLKAEHARKVEEEKAHETTEEKAPEPVVEPKEEAEEPKAATEEKAPEPVVEPKEEAEEPKAATEEPKVETTFSIDAWKKTYSNAKGKLEDEVMPWLWENIDAENWTFYFMTYNKLPEECRNEITSSNMLSGFLQRFDPDFRRISFGVLNVMGSGECFDIMGVWLIKGTELPTSVTDHPSYEFHTYEKLDIENPVHKKRITDYFCAEEEIDGVRIADAKVWK